MVKNKHNYQFHIGRNVLICAKCGKMKMRGRIETDCEEPIKLPALPLRINQDRPFSAKYSHFINNARKRKKPIREIRI